MSPAMRGKDRKPNHQETVIIFEGNPHHTERSK